MDTGIIAQQMLVLFLMMVTGYGIYKKGIVTAENAKLISALVMYVFNPCMIISGVLNKEISYGPAMVFENICLVLLFFAVLIPLSWVLARLLHPAEERINTYRLMMIFPNVGFMGIPLVRSTYGEEAVIIVAFYVVLYNLLVYSYGILLAMGAGRAGGETTEKTALPWKRVFNIGTASCVVAIVIFASGFSVPAPIGNFVDTMGATAVPLSMMLVGITVAQSDLKCIVTSARQWAFAAVKMLLIPCLLIPFMKRLPLQPVSYGIFILMNSMPVGSIVMMIEREYGNEEGKTAAGGIALTSVLAVLTIPFVSMLA